MAIRIILFDDNLKILEAFQTLFADLPDFELLCCFTNTAQVGKITQLYKPDVVLMDINIPPFDGIEATRIIARILPSAKVIIQTVFDEDEKVFAALCAGASGYLLKNATPESMIKAIFEIMEGGLSMSPSIASKVLNIFRSGLVQPPPAADPDCYKLSIREKEILKFLVEGFSYKMVADRCAISYETVKSHIKNIYVKLQVASMTEAVAKAIHEKLV